MGTKSRNSVLKSMAEELYNLVVDVMYKGNKFPPFFPQIYLLLPPNQLEMPPLALAAPSSTLLSNLSTALSVSALASFAYASTLLLARCACWSASAICAGDRFVSDEQLEVVV